MKKNPFYFLSLLMIPGIYSCGDLTQPLIDGPILFIQHFEVTPWQRLTPNGPIAQLKIEALFPQDCLDTEIDITEVAGNPKQYFINEFLDGPCNDIAEHYPTYFDDILVTEAISIDVFGNGQSVGDFNISSDKVEVSFEDQNLFVLSREEILLINKNIYWGFIEIDDESISDIAEERLSQTIEQAFTIQEGDYGHFVWSENELTLNESTASYARSYLHESNESSWPNVSEALQSIHDQYPDFKAKFTNWDGEIIEF